MLRLTILLVMLAATPAVADPAPLSAYMEQARVPPSARIAYGAEPSQVVELFLPKGRGPHPVVVLLHGGCYLKEFEGLPQTSAIADDLARRGYAVWNVEYRRFPEPGAGYPGTFQDVAMAIDGLKTEAPGRNLDLRRVVAVGHSAGGHLALWAAARGRLPASSPLHRPDPLRIGAVVSLAGIGDLEGQGDVFSRACGADTFPNLLDLKTRKGAYADTSPLALLPTGASVTMVSGAFDNVMPPFTGWQYVQKVRKAGDRAVAVAIPGAGHFDPVIPTTPAWRTVIGIVAREMKALR